MKKLLIMLAFLVVSVSCDENFPGAQQIFYIKNNSNQSVSYMIGENYPDTTVPNNRIVTLLPGEEHTEGFKEDKFEDFF